MSFSCIDVVVSDCCKLGYKKAVYLVLYCNCHYVIFLYIDVAVSACCELGYLKAFETGLSTFCFGLTFSSEPQCNNEAQQCCECCHTSLRKLDAGQICTDDGVAGAQCKIITKRCCEYEDKQGNTTLLDNSKFITKKIYTMYIFCV